MTDFDDMLEELGELGRFQITIYILICLPVFFASANGLTYIFSTSVPNYRCLIPECDDEDQPTYKESWLSWAIPNENANFESEYKPARCERFVGNYLQYFDGCSNDSFTNQTERCSEWVFDAEERTIVNDWNITCVENQWKLSFVGSSHFIGVMIGTAVFGALADRYGRKMTFVFCVILMSISGVVKIFSPNYITFIILQFIHSLGNAGIYPLTFIIGMELVAKEKRGGAAMILNYFYALGEAFVALVAWATKDWVWLQLIVSAPAILFAVYFWLVPESVRWLLANERYQEAKAVVIKAAETNKITLSKFVLNFFQEQEENCAKQLPQANEGLKFVTILKLILKSNKLVIRFLFVFFIWFVNAFVFYGLSINSISLSGDKYLNFALVSLVEIPGYSLAWMCIQKFGRRPALVGSLLICGVTCSVSVLVPANTQWAVLVLFLIGKLGVTSSFGIIYVHTSEMFPTIIRSGGVGAASTMARFGALLAPFVPLLGIYVQALPMLLFGGLAIAAGILAIKLPETLGVKLPETVADAERL